MVAEEPALLPLLYEYPYDFTDYSADFLAQLIGTAPDQRVADALREVTGDPWTLEPKKKFTLYKAQVTYVGANQVGFPTSKRYKWVLLVTLSTRYKTRKMYLVFNNLS